MKNWRQKQFSLFWSQLEELVQETLDPTWKPSGAHNRVIAVSRATSLTWKIDGPSNSMSTTATIETPGSSWTDLETAGQGIRQSNVKKISAEPSLKKPMEDSSPVKGDSRNKSDVYPAAWEGESLSE
jgi:hypothetical protein